MRQLLFCLVLLLLIVSSVTAQILNIDKTDTASYRPQTVLTGNLSLGLEIDKQQTTLVDASNFVNAALQHEHELFILSGSYRFTYNGPQDFLNAGYLHLRWRHNYLGKVHPETYTQVQWDNKRGMLHRIVAGGNIRYNFWEKKEGEISIATGAFYEDERWNYSAVDSGKIPALHPDVRRRKLKWNNYIKYEGRLSAISNITLAVFYQSAFDHLFIPRVSTVVNFDIAMSKHFAFGIRYSGLYDAKPVVPIFKFYYSFSNSLTYNF